MRSEHEKVVRSALLLEQSLYEEDPKAFITAKREEMAVAVEALDFETAAIIRDQIYALEGKEVVDKKESKKRSIQKRTR